MFQLRRPKLRVTLLGVLAFTAALALHYQSKANSLYKTIIPKQTTYFTLRVKKITVNGLSMLVVK